MLFYLIKNLEVNKCTAKISINVAYGQILVNLDPYDKN